MGVRLWSGLSFCFFIYVLFWMLASNFKVDIVDIIDSKYG